MMSAGSVPIISGTTARQGENPKEHQVMSPKVTMNHHANDIKTAVFAPRTIPRPNRGIEPYDGNALKKIDQDIEQEEARRGFAETVVRHSSEIVPEQRCHHRSQDDPKETGEQSAGDHARPVDFAHALGLTIDTLRTAVSPTSLGVANNQIAAATNRNGDE